MNEVNVNGNVNRIYEYYKKMNISKLYYKGVLFKLLLLFQIITGIFLVIFIFFIIKNNFTIDDNLLLSLGFMFLGAILCSLIFFILKYKVSEKIKEEFKITYKEKKFFNERLIRNEYIMIAKQKELISHLKEVKIKSKEQKKLLASMLYQRHIDSKISNIWIIGVLVVLILPIWNRFIQIYMKDESMSISDLISTFGKISPLLILMLFLISYLRTTVLNNILQIINLKSQRYKEMYEIVQQSLLTNNFSKKDKQL